MPDASGLLVMAQMPTRRKLAIAKSHPQSRPREEHSCDDSPDAALVLVLDVFVDLSDVLRYWRKGMSVFPLCGRTSCLNVSKAVARNTVVNRRPTQRQRSYPEREDRDRAFGERFDVVHLHDRRRWRKPLE